MGRRGHEGHRRLGGKKGGVSSESFQDIEAGDRRPTPGGERADSHDEAGKARFAPARRVRVVL